MGKKNAHRFEPMGNILAWVGYHCSANNADQNERQNSKHIGKLLM